MHLTKKKTSVLNTVNFLEYTTTTTDTLCYSTVCHRSWSRGGKTRRTASLHSQKSKREECSFWTDTLCIHLFTKTHWSFLPTLHHVLHKLFKQARRQLLQECWVMFLLFTCWCAAPVYHLHLLLLDSLCALGSFLLSICRWNVGARHWSPPNPRNPPNTGPQPPNPNLNPSPNGRRDQWEIPLICVTSWANLWSFFQPGTSSRKTSGDVKGRQCKWYRVRHHGIVLVELSHTPGVVHTDELETWMWRRCSRQFVLEIFRSKDCLVLLKAEIHNMSHCVSKMLLCNRISS